MASSLGLSRAASTVLLVVTALLLAVVTLPGFARFDHETPRDVDLARVGGSARRGLVVVFVDSLRDETARDAGVMPNLVALAQQSATYGVSPCRDQLTYLCLRAAFTGKDESELFALGDNFRHDAHASDTTSVFAAARAQGRVVTLLGAADLSPYGGGATQSRFFGSGVSDEEALGAVWLAEAHRPGGVTVVGFGRGDRIAHSQGADAEETRAAFARIDVAIGNIAAAAGDDTLVVLGDHGHDGHGHHLPGTPGRTFALYRGADFVAGSRGDLALTDHRVLLGLTLGVPTPAVLARAETIVATWREDTRVELGLRIGALARESSETPRTGGPGPRGALLLGLVAAISLAFLARGVLGRLAPIWLAAALLAGHGYDFVRQHVHDHGYTPERALWLMAPIGFALILTRFTRGPRFLAPTEPLRAVAVGTCVALLGLFPTAYFYGSLRASILAVTIALGVLAIHHARGGRLLEGGLSALCALCVASLYAVHGEAEGSRYVMTNIAFHPLLAATVPRLVLAAITFGLVRHRHALAASSLVVLLVAQTLLYASTPRERAALEMIQAIVALGLWLGDRHLAHRALRSVLVACACGWLLVPVVGLRLSGIDFGFTFRLIPVARYEELWGLVAVLTVLKLSLPFTLLGVLAMAREDGAEMTLGAMRLLAVRLVLLLVFVAGYRATRPAGSRVVLEMLAEGVLLPFALLAIAAVPACVGAWRLVWGRQAGAAQVLRL